MTTFRSLSLTLSWNLYQRNALTRITRLQVSMGFVNYKMSKSGFTSFPGPSGQLQDNQGVSHILERLVAGVPNLQQISNEAGILPIGHTAPPMICDHIR